MDRAHSKEKESLSRTFHLILKQIEYRMRVRENPHYAIPISLDVINDSKIKNGEYFLDDLGVSEDEWKYLLHREKISKALMYWNKCNTDWGNDYYYESLMYFLKPKGDVDCAEIGVTPRDIDGLQIKKMFTQWTIANKHLWTEIRQVSAFFKKRGIYDNIEDIVKDAIKTSDKGESMRHAFILLLEEELRRVKI